MNEVQLSEDYEKTIYFLTTESLGVPGTYLIDLGRMKGWVDLRGTQRFWTQNL